MKIPDDVLFDYYKLTTDLDLAETDKLIKQDNGIFNLIYYLKPKRAYAEVYINKKFDVTNLVKYMEKLKKEDSSYTYFHLFSTAISKLIYERPYLNRFIIAGRMYEREEVTLSFVAKTMFNDSAEELMTVIPVLKEDNLVTVKDKILSSVNKMRNNTSHDKTNDTISKVTNHDTCTIATLDFFTFGNLDIEIFDIAVREV